ncbi:hypothetical protein [Neoroseomonas oryzicola]|uniref:Uncharacterized protein n=1 Tax=Neoroseomonas oryzicola TaxID=535904 RepID=A0A9X9WMK7_9PROT|nr:hypothetical protein [Neoroseomonas oryzicola]MBR0661567.1 hypothetical protein [Neoroseomonas oryzicola]NKE16939.1 hypothetical protein [Neoroseomonas oryzicola]
MYVDYRMAPDPMVFGTDWHAVSIDAGAGAIFALGENGEALKISSAGNELELIDPPSDGPPDQGPLREIRAIRERVFAVGMGRQAYCRDHLGHWTRVDAGLLDRSSGMATGLTSICGSADGTLAAVGYRGEIWEFTEHWQRLSSPSNLLLTHVTEHNAILYASGILGLLIRREKAGWAIVDTAPLAHDIWDIESFDGRLYCGTSNGLFVMDEDGDLSEVAALRELGQLQCSSLSAGFGRLWCFGGERVSVTEDGLMWRSMPVLDVPERREMPSGGDA